MGTSSSSSGPSGQQSLLPPWYNNSSGDTVQLPTDDPNSQGKQPTNDDPPELDGESGPDKKDDNAAIVPQISGNWKDVKGAFTRYTKSTKGSNIRKAARTYV